MQIETLPLKSALEKVTKATGKSALLPIISYILVQKRSNRLLLTGTDLELRIEDSVPVGGDEPDFEVCVLAEQFAKIVGKLTSDEATLTLLDESLLLKSKGVKANIPISSTEDFPTKPTDFPNSIYFSSSADAIDAIRRVPFYSSDKAKAILNCIHMETKDGKFIASATDGYTVGFASVPVSADESLSGSLNIPGASMQAVLSALGKLEGSDLTIEYGGSQARFTAATTSVTTRVIADKYPDSTKIVPKAFGNEFTVDVKELIAAIDAASVFAKAEIPVVNLSAMPAFLSVSSSSTHGTFNNTEDALCAELAGECEEIREQTVTFNIAFLLRILKQISQLSDRVILRKSTSNLVVKFEPEGVSDYHVSMMSILPI